MPLHNAMDFIDIGMGRIWHVDYRGGMLPGIAVVIHWIYRGSRIGIDCMDPIDAYRDCNRCVMDIERIGPIETAMTIGPIPITAVIQQII